VPPKRLVWAVAALAEGLGIRAVARGFEVDPNTVLQWLVEAADQATAFSQYFLDDVHVDQVQLDELFALLSAIKTGQVSEAEALTHLARSSYWVGERSTPSPSCCWLWTVATARSRWRNVWSIASWRY
jgi:hypothetical protein